MATKREFKSAYPQGGNKYEIVITETIELDVDGQIGEFSKEVWIDQFMEDYGLPYDEAKNLADELNFMNNCCFFEEEEEEE